MDIQTLLLQHAEGAFDRVFSANNAGYVVKATTVRETDTGPVPGRLHLGPCHACVSREMHRPSTIAVITASDPTLVDNPGAVAFYDWLINRSFFSPVFLCKDPVLSLKNGFLKRVDVNASRWLGAAQLSRLATSEYKLSMKAVYDVLASGYKIHPLLLVLLSSNQYWSTNGKQVHAKSGYTDTMTYNNGYTHLPMVYLKSKELLKEACLDNPDKPIANRFLDQDVNLQFKQTGWKTSSNQILTLDPQSNSGSMDPTLKQYMQQAFPSKGQSSLLFGHKEVQTDYTCFWPYAVKELQRLTRSSSDLKGQQPVVLEPLVELSALLKLGE